MEITDSVFMKIINYLKASDNLDLFLDVFNQIKESKTNNLNTIGTIGSVLREKVINEETGSKITYVIYPWFVKKILRDALSVIPKSEADEMIKDTMGLFIGTMLFISTLKSMEEELK